MSWKRPLQSLKIWLKNRKTKKQSTILRDQILKRVGLVPDRMTYLPERDYWDVYWDAQHTDEFLNLRVGKSLIQRIDGVATIVVWINFRHAMSQLDRPQPFPLSTARATQVMVTSLQGAIEALDAE